VLAEGVLTWETGRYEDANKLLEKGTKYRTWDWRLPYYLGFNYFYFLKDYAKGGEYLMEASRRPKSPRFLPRLAARLSYYGDQAKTGVLFLMGVLEQTKDEKLRESLMKRKNALERAAWIEERVAKFKAEQMRLPANLDELILLGYAEALPEDPYGGKWIIMPKGRVFSTSKFADARKNEKQQKNPGERN
jgi:tetratricopeptide (TPR) repeat protein